MCYFGFEWLTAASSIPVDLINWLLRAIYNVFEVAKIDIWMLVTGELQRIIDVI